MIVGNVYEASFTGFNYGLLQLTKNVRSAFEVIRTPPSLLSITHAWDLVLK